MAADSELTAQRKSQEQVQLAAEHIMSEARPGVSSTITYVWKSTAGTKCYVHVSVDEFGCMNSLVINVGASGTTIHNVVNAMGRVISIALRDDKTKALDLVHTLEDVSSEVDWMNENLGRTKSIPGIIALILLRHVDIENALETLHSEH